MKVKGRFVRLLVSHNGVVFDEVCFFSGERACVMRKKNIFRVIVNLMSTLTHFILCPVERNVN